MADIETAYQTVISYVPLFRTSWASIEDTADVHISTLTVKSFHHRVGRQSK